MVSISIQNISSPATVGINSPFSISFNVVYSGFKFWKKSKIFSRIRWGTNFFEEYYYVRCNGKVKTTVNVPGITESTQFIMTVGFSD